MRLLFLLLTLIETLIAAGALLMPRGVWSFSPVRLAFAGAGLLWGAALSFGWLRLIRHEPAEGRNRLRIAKYAQLALAGSAVSFLLLLFARYAFENPSLNLTAAYIRQAQPLLILLAVTLLQGFIGIVFWIDRQTKSIPRTLQQITRNGRIVWQALLILLACLTLMLAFLPIRANYYPSFDSSIFSYIGQQILKGRTPYLNAWDHKPALIFYLDALGLKLAGGRLIGIWGLELLALFVGGLLFFQTLKKAFSETISLGVTMLGILHYARLFDFGNYTEEFSLFFQLCALALYFSERFSAKPFLRATLSGLLCGLAFTCKQNTVGMWAGLILLDFLLHFPRGKGKKWVTSQQLRRLLVFVGVFLLVNACWVGFFAAKGALRAYWNTAFVYNFVYSQKSGESRWATGLTTLTFLPGISAFLLLAFLSAPAALIVALRRRVEKQQPLLLWALLTLPIELLLASLSGMNYQHYFILCIPSACVFAAWFADLLRRSLSTRLRHGLAGTFVTLLLIAAALPLLPVYRANYEARMPSANTKTAAWLLENTAPDDPVQLWGSSLAPYVLTGRSSPSRYFNVRPLYLFPGYLQDEQWALFLAELQNDPPRVIVYMRDSFLAPVPYEADGFCKVSALPKYQTATYAFLCEHYRYQESINEGRDDAWGIFIYQ